MCFFWIGFNCRMFHTLEKAHSFLEHTHFWKAFMGFIRRTCEVARYVNKQEGIQNSSLGKSAPGLQPCGRFPHLLWQHSFLRDKQSPEGRGLTGGLASTRTLSFPFTLSVVTRLTTGPSTVTASTLNWPSWAHKYLSVQTHRNPTFESPDALCVVPPPLAVCLPQVPVASRFPSLLTSVRAKSPLKYELYNLQLQNSQRIILVSEKLCF